MNPADGFELKQEDDAMKYFTNVLERFGKRPPMKTAPSEAVEAPASTTENGTARVSSEPSSGADIRAADVPAAPSMVGRD